MSMSVDVIDRVVPFCTKNDIDKEQTIKLCLDLVSTIGEPVYSDDDEKQWHVDRIEECWKENIT
jgi:hypothetical protein